MQLDKRNHFGFVDGTTSLKCKRKTVRDLYEMTTRPWWRRVIDWWMADV